MLRRQARLRREFIYRKSIEERDRSTLERKERVKQSLDENEPLPPELCDDALQLLKSSKWDDAGGEGAAAAMDDEYRWAGVEDPKIVVTTSREPSMKLKQFAKELKLLLPNSQRINRGNYEIAQLVDACRANDVTDVVLVHEHRGVPNGLVVSHLPFGPTAFFTIVNAITRHDIPDVAPMSEQFPHLIFDHFTSKLGKRCANILKYLFPVPKADSKRVLTFANRDDFISFRHHTFRVVDGTVELKEVGPRFELKLYQIILGTIDQKDTADVEWVLRPYMNTTKKRSFLATPAPDEK